VGWLLSQFIAHVNHLPQIGNQTFSAPSFPFKTLAHSFYFIYYYYCYLSYLLSSNSVVILENLPTSQRCFAYTWLHLTSLRFVCVVQWPMSSSILNTVRDNLDIAMKPHGVRLVEAHSLQSERRPITPSSLPRNPQSGSERRPTLSALSTVCIPLGCRFCFSSHFTLQEFMGLIHQLSTLSPASPFSATQSCCFPYCKRNKGKLINKGTHHRAHWKGTVFRVFSNGRLKGNFLIPLNLLFSIRFQFVPLDGRSLIILVTWSVA